jgi:hypothetical protein
MSQPPTDGEAMPEIPSAVIPLMADRLKGCSAASTRNTSRPACAAGGRAGLRAGVAQCIRIGVVLKSDQ